MHSNRPRQQRKFKTMSNLNIAQLPIEQGLSFRTIKAAGQDRER